LIAVRNRLGNNDVITFAVGQQPTDRFNDTRFFVDVIDITPTVAFRMCIMPNDKHLRAFDHGNDLTDPPPTRHAPRP